jgi:hypothetical protein
MIQPRVSVALLTTLAIALPSTNSMEAQGRGRGQEQGRAYAYGQAMRLSGTYQLDRTRSDNAQQVAQRAAAGFPTAQRDRVFQNVVNRLQAPEQLSLQVTNRTVTMMSTNADRITFEADGNVRTETGPDGRQVATRADIRRGVITISMMGSRGSEYTATFEPINNDGLVVTRRLDNGINRDPVIVVSEYRRVSDARWNLATTNPTSSSGGYTSGGVWSNTERARRNTVFITSGTTLTTQLDRAMNTNTVRNGDRISLTVVEPVMYRGTVIEGVVGRAASGDQDNILVDFDVVRMPDGRTGEFDGVIQTIRMPDGKVIRVEAGAVRGDDAGHTNSVKSGAIGAGVGAILGAIIGGKKGAVVGGVAGAGGGIILDKTGNNRTLPAGTTFTVSAIAAGSTVTRR